VVKLLYGSQEVALGHEELEAALHILYNVIGTFSP